MSAASLAPRSLPSLPAPLRSGPRLILPACAALLILGAPLSPAHADRVQVFSVRNVQDVNQGEELAEAIGRIHGIQRASFEKVRAELAVRFANGVRDDVVLEALAAAGCQGLIGPGKGAYQPIPEYPAGADVRLLSSDGSTVGPLDKLRVSGKYTVFDVFATWCGPCRLIDARLRELSAARRDLAVRKLNVVDFDSPLAGQLGPRLTALPHLIVFTPSGRRIEFEGYDPQALDAALAAK